jgi:hypothetical protein
MTCVTNAIPLDLRRSTVKASVNINRLDNGGRWFDGFSEFEAELNSPNMLALDIAVHMVRAGTLPAVRDL